MSPCRLNQEPPNLGVSKDFCRARPSFGQVSRCEDEELALAIQCLAGGVDGEYLRWTSIVDVLLAAGTRRR